MKMRELEDVLSEFKVFNYRKGGKPNQFRITKSFFYTNGYSAERFANTIQERLNAKGIKHTILDHGEHWHSFVGGAKPGSAQDSFWYVIVDFNKNSLA